MTAASGADQPTPATWDHRPLGGGLCVCGQPVHTAPGLRDQLAEALCDDTEDGPAWDYAEDYERDYWRRKADRLFLPLIEADRERAVANALAARVLRDIDRSIEGEPTTTTEETTA